MQRTIKDYDYKSLSPSINKVVLTSLNIPTSHQNQTFYSKHLNTFNHQKQSTDQPFNHHKQSTDQPFNHQKQSTDQPFNHQKQSTDQLFNHQKQSTDQLFNHCKPKLNTLQVFPSLHSQHHFKKVGVQLSSAKKKNHHNIYQKVIEISRQLQEYRSEQYKADEQNHYQSNAIYKYESILRNVNSEQDYQYMNNSDDNINGNTSNNNRTDFYTKIQSKHDNKYLMANCQNDIANFTDNEVQQIVQFNRTNQQVVGINRNNSNHNCQLNSYKTSNFKNLNEAKRNQNKQGKVYQYQNLGQSKKQKFDNIKQAIQQKIDNFKQTSKSISRDEYNISLFKDQVNRQNYYQSNQNTCSGKSQQTTLKETTMKTDDFKEYRKEKGSYDCQKEYQQQSNVDLDEVRIQNNIQKTQSSMEKKQTTIQRINQRRIHIDFSINSSQINSKSCEQQQNCKNRSNNCKNRSDDCQDQQQGQHQSQHQYQNIQNTDYIDRSEDQQKQNECQNVEIEQYPKIYQERMKAIFDKLQRMVYQQGEERKDWLKREENYIEMIKSQNERIKLLERMSFKRQ